MKRESSVECFSSSYFSAWIVLDVSKEIMSNDTLTLSNADEAIDFLVNQGKLNIPLHLADCTDWKQQLNLILVKCCFCYHLFLDLSGPKGRINVETSLAVDKIEIITYNDGLQPDQLVNLVKLATSGKYG